MKRDSGFSLIELMMVVAIVGILSAIALPSYRDHIIRGKLIDAVSALSDNRVKQEQFFQDNRTYTGGPVPGTTKYFSFAASGVSATAYTMTATGLNDLAAYSYTINQSNTKGSSTPWGNKACWVVKKSGECY